MVAQHQHGASTHMPNNLWQPGVSGNPAGRPRGSRNELSEEVICALLRDFRQHGQKAVARVRRTQPAAYLKILALLVPREHKVEHSNALKDLTDEQLEAMIEYIETSLAAQAGAPVKMIEGTIEPTAVPAAASRARVSEAQVEPADDRGRHGGRPAGAHEKEKSTGQVIADLSPRRAGSPSWSVCGTTDQLVRLSVCASLPPDRAYGKPSPRRHLKSQQIQGLTISDLCIPKSFDRCMAMRYAGLIEARAEDL